MPPKPAAFDGSCPLNTPKQTTLGCGTNNTSTDLPSDLPTGKAPRPADLRKAILAEGKPLALGFEHVVIDAAKCCADLWLNNDELTF